MRVVSHCALTEFWRCLAAIVLAFLQVAALIPVGELAQRKSAAKAHFDGVVVRASQQRNASCCLLTPCLARPPQTPAGWDWERTQTDYITLVSPGILNTTHKWLVRARLFKLILSQSTEGWWEPSSGTAFALEARPASETENLPPSIQSRVAAMLGAAVEVALTGEEDGLSAGRHDCDWDEAVDTAVEGADMGAAADNDMQATQPRSSELTRLASLRRFSSSAETVTDCPLTCSTRAVVASIPIRLARVRNDDAEVKTARVWCTMCVIAVLERMNNSFIWGDGYVLCMHALLTCRMHAACMHARSIAFALLTCRSSLRRTPAATSIPSRSARYATELANGLRATRRSTRRWPWRWRTASCRSAQSRLPCSGTALASCAWPSCGVQRRFATP